MLHNKKCLPCETGGRQLAADRVILLFKEIPDWTPLETEKKIEKSFRFQNFQEALAFINKVGQLAEEQGHHPDICLFDWNRVKISLWTHAVGGLTENDFILAAKIDRL